MSQSLDVDFTLMVHKYRSAHGKSATQNVFGVMTSAVTTLCESRSGEIAGIHPVTPI